MQAAKMLQNFGLKVTRSTFAEIGSGKVSLTLGTAAATNHEVPKASLPTHAILTLHNTARKNALSPSMMAQLADHIDTLHSWVNVPASKIKEEHSSLIGVVLTGEGGTFCSGFDLGVAAESFLNAESGKEFSALMHDTLTRLRDLPLISVAAVDGYALGGGAELASACDLRIAHDKATIQFVQTQMGVVPGWQGGTRLTQLLGPAKALTLLASSQPLTGAQAFNYGLVDFLADGDETPHSLASQLMDSWGARGYASAIRGCKEVVHGAVTAQDSETAFEREREVFGRFWGAADNLEAVAKRAQHRKRHHLHHSQQQQQQNEEVDQTKKKSKL